MPTKTTKSGRTSRQPRRPNRKGKDAPPPRRPLGRKRANTTPASSASDSEATEEEEVEKGEASSGEESREQTLLADALKTQTNELRLSGGEFHPVNSTVFLPLKETFEPYAHVVGADFAGLSENKTKRYQVLFDVNKSGKEKDVTARIQRSMMIDGANKLRMLMALKMQVDGQRHTAMMKVLNKLVDVTDSAAASTAGNGTAAKKKKQRVITDYAANFGGKASMTEWLRVAAMQMCSPEYEEMPLFVNKKEMTDRLLNDPAMLEKDPQRHKAKVYAAINSGL
jgi:hypothetical protein